MEYAKEPDINESELPKTQEELKEIIDKARAEERLELMKLFNQTLGHYGRNKLGPAYGYSELAINIELSKEELLTFMQEILKSASATIDIFDRLEKADPNIVVYPGHFPVIDLGLEPKKEESSEEHK